MALLIVVFFLLNLKALYAHSVETTSLKISSVFDDNYAVTWGSNHVSFSLQGREIRLSMDNTSGSGFGSKAIYSTGFFHLKMKVPNRDSAGVVTAFYLSSHSNNHDELDFEFLGNLEGKPYTLQTNVFVNGHGNREQRFHLWFDPTEDFHDYRILWNPYQIVFFVDKRPIRIYKNMREAGVEYPSQPMQIIASLWDGDDWATDGGKVKTNWTYAPFFAYFRGFNVNGCPVHDSNPQDCYSSKYWWNSNKYRTLSPPQQKLYQRVRDKYLKYDYCKDRKRFPKPPPECPQ
ncbi:xyloglucan endotransglucosylase/hydrolase protein 2 [Amborella trichopoda]|nr:xyloglucan endotransglucosylase/hydrolase protein 2 [Amborella trichopoda]|eukprot:XP_006856899.2 xyloglucan endotransglucosylase/hydrolase protein 2 [Amborella trichopoda]